MGGWQQAPPPGQGFFNPHQQQFQAAAQQHQTTFPPSQGGGVGGFMAAGPPAHNIGAVTGFPMNQGMGQGQISGGFSQQHHQQQQFQAMQQQQQQQVIKCILVYFMCETVERGRKRERQRDILFSSPHSRWRTSRSSNDWPEKNRKREIWRYKNES
jgi:hypothetical protein